MLRDDDLGRFPYREKLSEAIAVLYAQNNGLEHYIKSLPLGSSVARTRGSVIVANDLTGKSSHKFDSDYLEDATVVGRQALFGGTITNAVVVVVERRVARFLNRL